MINMTVESPEQLWVALGVAFFKPKGPSITDYEIAKRRFFSFNNVLTVNNWPKHWNNPLLFDIVGYSSTGTKMNILRNTYLNRDNWGDLHGALEEFKDMDSIKTFGMNFNLKPQGKGGCLASFHVMKYDGQVDIVVHMKVAEIPRKFVGDLIFIGQLIEELDLPQESYRVTFMLSSLYFSIIGLRAYVPIIGRNSMDYRGLPIEEPRNYQVSVQQMIGKATRKLMDRFDVDIMDKGLGMEPYKIIEKGRV
jgi:hypothetical protein